MTPAGRASLEAEWALWGRPAGGGAGHVVLACSDGRLRRAHFEKIITRFSPGTPDTDGALPRVTIGALDISKVPHLALGLQTSQPVRDDQGVTTMRLFVFPYSVLSRRAVAYRALYQHLADAALPDSMTGPPVTVRPPLLDTRAVAADIQELGAGPAWVAALVARGRNVCVVQAESTSLDERLRFLDAVAALLPYGYRAKLTTTTWANSATRHPFRLFFARHAGNGAIGIPLRGPAAPLSESVTERDHLGPLKAAVDRLGAEAVIRSFLEDSDPRSCNDPGPAVRAVHAMITPRPRAEVTGLAELRALFERPENVLALDHQSARRAMSRLVELAEPQDWPTIDAWWRDLAGDDFVGLLTPAFEKCRARLWSDEPGKIQTQLLIAYRYEQGDDFLAALVVPPGLPRDRVERGLSATAQAVYDSAIVSGAMAAHPRTLRSLVDHPQVMCELVAQLASSDPARLEPSMDWLGTVRAKDPRVLSVLRDVLLARDPSPLPLERLEGLAESGRSCVAALLEAACAVGRLPLVLQAFVEMLIEGRSIRRDESRYWADRLSGLRLSDPGFQGVIDVLLLVLGGRPDILRHLAQDAEDSYRRNFLRTCALPWPDGRGPAAVLAEILDESGSREARLTLPDGSEHTPPLRALLVEALGPVTNRPVGGDADAIVQDLVAGYRQGMTAERCLDGLGPDSWPAVLAVTVVCRLEPALVRQGVMPRSARRWSAALVRHLTSGRWDHDHARDFSARLLERVVADMKGRLSLLHAVASGEQSHRDLRDVHAVLERVLETFGTDHGTAHGRAGAARGPERNGRPDTAAQGSEGRSVTRGSAQ
ncbi:hypothetical protein [Actinomadura macra]|uniref:hypothetical protein n=1 Tax=Actinomadura macra TaxID=46164 RepID=UPI000837A37C|nr:hypothetical protein [Actinomadura macra]